ncbi:unnamed protein product, partial [Mesorhabditis spiculigera]
MTRMIDVDEVSRHNTRESGWIIIKGKVYDVSKFFDEHPGGPEVLMEQIGKDATIPFYDVGHSSDARKMLEDYFVGDLIGGPTLSAPQTAPRAQTASQDRASLAEIILSPTWTNFLIPTAVGIFVFVFYKGAMHLIS